MLNLLKKMGVYKLNVEEIQEKLEDFLHSLEGDYDIEDFVKAYNNIAKKEKWKERLMFKK